MHNQLPEAGIPRYLQLPEGGTRRQEEGILRQAQGRTSREHQPGEALGGTQTPREVDTRGPEGIRALGGILRQRESLVFHSSQSKEI